MNSDRTEDADADQRREELSAYEKILQEVKKQFERSRADVQVLSEIIDKSAEELKAIGSHSSEAIIKASGALKKDLIGSAERTKPLLQSLEQGAVQTAEALHKAGAQLWSQLALSGRDSATAWRDWTGGTVESLLNNISEVSSKLGSGLGEALTYHTGEVTHGGTFRCVACGTTLTLKAPGHLPPCPKCHKTAFRHA